MTFKNKGGCHGHDKAAAKTRHRRLTLFRRSTQPHPCSRTSTTELLRKTKRCMRPSCDHARALTPNIGQSALSTQLSAQFLRLNHELPAPYARPTCVSPNSQTGRVSRVRPNSPTPAHRVRQAWRPLPARTACCEHCRVSTPIAVADATRRLSSTSLERPGGIADSPHARNGTLAFFNIP